MQADRDEPVGVAIPVAPADGYGAAGKGTGDRQETAAVRASADHRAAAAPRTACESQTDSSHLPGGTVAGSTASAETAAAAERAGQPGDHAQESSLGHGLRAGWAGQREGVAHSDGGGHLHAGGTGHYGGHVHSGAAGAAG